MKINLENMKEIAERLDNNETLFDVGINADDVCSMAYQIQYLFEAMRNIQAKKDLFINSAFKETRARCEAYEDSLDLLNVALVDK